MKECNSNDKRERLFSLDLLRGMDMFLLVMVGGPMRAIQSSYHCFSEPVWRHFCHAWSGFGFWDIIYPLFVFMCGAAIPFSLERRLAKTGPNWTYWRHVLGRFILLWVFGMISQGELLSLDPMKIAPYCNTLQSIAAGYLIAAVALSFRSRLVMIALPLVLALGYSAMLIFLGDYSQEGNFSNIVEMKILHALLPAGSTAFETWHYTWFLTSMMFGAMTFCGYHATKILQLTCSQWRRCGFLAVYAAILLAVGFGSMPWIPVLKPICTLSYTALAMGWSVLALAVLYAVTDILRFRRGCGLFTLLGRHSLFAYMTCELGAIFTAGASQLLGGLGLWIGKTPMPVVIAIGSSFLRLGAVWVWDRLRAKGHCNSGTHFTEMRPQDSLAVITAGI